MMIEILANRKVITARPEETVTEIAKKMERSNVGSVVIVRDDNSPVGIITDRDMAIKVIAQGKVPETTRVEDVMTKDLMVLNENMGILEALKYVKERGIRRYPVVDSQGKLIGIVTLDDIIHLLGEEMKYVAHIIEKESPNL